MNVMLVKIRVTTPKGAGGLLAEVVHDRARQPANPAINALEASGEAFMPDNCPHADAARAARGGTGVADVTRTAAAPMRITRSWRACARQTLRQYGRLPRLVRPRRTPGRSHHSSMRSGAVARVADDRGLNLEGIRRHSGTGGFHVERLRPRAGLRASLDRRTAEPPGRQVFAAGFEATSFRWSGTRAKRSSIGCSVAGPFGRGLGAQVGEHAGRNPSRRSSEVHPEKYGINLAQITKHGKLTP